MSFEKRTHGIRATYVDGCRCTDCIQADRDYQRLRRYKAREARGDASGEMCLWCLQTFRRKAGFAHHEQACIKR